jgi:hypothetical protein
MSASGSGDSSAAFADAAVMRWRTVAAALSPVIGAQGFGALFRRSVHLAKARFPGLAAVDDAGPPFTFASLQAALGRMPGTEADAMQSDLLRTFHELLAKLIGGSLTERLLHPRTDATKNPEHPSALERKL